MSTPSTEVREGGSGVSEGTGPVPVLCCPQCGLTITPRQPWLVADYCPRCLAHRRAAVALVRTDANARGGQERP
jgi:hypothetical protein